MNLRRIYGEVDGRVQGVGFRYFTQETAEALHIKGWVRNKPNGNVEFEAQGAAEEITLFVQQIELGPPLSYVKKLHQSDLPLKEGETGFKVRY